MLTDHRCSAARLRVLIAAESYAPSVNGVANSVARMESHLRDRGHEVLVLAPEAGPPGSGESVVRVPSRPLPFYRGLPVGLPSTDLVDRVIDCFQPDVVHLAAPVLLGYRVASAAVNRQIPVVAIFQTDLSGFANSYGLGSTAPALWWWLRRVHRLADVTLAPSTATAAQLTDHGIPRVGLWGRGVDLEMFDPALRSEVLRRRWTGSGAGSKPVIVGYVGRLAREKRIDLLRGVDRWPDTQLVIVGDGPERLDLERNLPGAHFTGLLRGRDLGSAVASFDLFAHTGAHETFCQAIQEAMASGLPIVAPASGGPVDLVEPDVNGLLYDPGDRAELERAVRRLADDPVLRASMGSAGQQRTAGRSWDRVCDELIEVYRRCCASRPCRRRPSPALVSTPAG